MPFADAGRAIAMLLRQFANRQPIRRDQRLPPHADDAGLKRRPPMIAPREQRVARRRAAARARMPVREAHALGGEPVHVRRGDFAALRVVRLHVAIPEVIREDDDEVWLRSEEGGAEGEKEKEVFHDRERLFG
jgi:hypothetical protein